MERDRLYVQESGSNQKNMSVRQHNAYLLAQAKQLVPPEGHLAAELQQFLKHYGENKARYEAVGKKTGLPADLVAALHWREANGRFDRLMSNGDPLDKKSTKYPKDGPYASWEDSAFAALNAADKQENRKTSGLDKDPNDIVALASFAELWNGLGYYDRGVPSPYVFSGTDVYSKGKYIADGKYDADVVDRQIGVIPMLVQLRRMVKP